MDVRILGPLEVGNGDGPPVRTLGGAKQRAVLALLVLHRGELVSIDRFHGIAVHIGARISALAGPGEVLASSTVADLVAGSGLRFTDRGTHALKGVPGEWRIVALAQDGDSERPVLDQDESLMRASDRLTLRLARHMPRSMRAATRLVRRG